MDMIKYENYNATTRPIIFQQIRNFDNLKIFGKILIFPNFMIERFTMHVWGGGHSTSPPCGNLVDGLPHDCHTKTVAKPARPSAAENDKPCP